MNLNSFVFGGKMDNKKIVKINQNDLKPLKPTGEDTGFPFTFFHYKKVSMHFNGKDTFVSSKEVSYKNNKLETKEFEGVSVGNEVFNEFFKAQMEIAGKVLKLFNPFLFFLPFKKDTDRK